MGRPHAQHLPRAAGQLNRRFRDGLLLRSAYTWSKAIDEAPYSDWTEYRYNAAIVFDRNRALADHDIPHNFQLAAVYELPFGKEKRWATSGLSSALFGGWQLNGVFAAYAGRPFNLTASDSSLNMPGNQQTPDQISDNVEVFGNVGNDGTYFDTTAFARVTEVRFGDVGRNSMRGPGVANLDLGLFRSFKIRTSRAAVPPGGVQRDQYAAFRQPERQRQQRELRARAGHAVRGCDGSVAARDFRFGRLVMKTVRSVLATARAGFLHSLPAPAERMVAAARRSRLESRASRACARR